jgi:hypothetical protein
MMTMTAVLAVDDVYDAADQNIEISSIHHHHHHHVLNLLLMDIRVVATNAAL